MKQTYQILLSIIILISKRTEDIVLKWRYIEHYISFSYKKIEYSQFKNI